MGRRPDLEARRGGWIDVQASAAGECAINGVRYGDALSASSIQGHTESVAAAVIADKGVIIWQSGRSVRAGEMHRAAVPADRVVGGVQRRDSDIERYAGSNVSRSDDA